MLSNIRNLVAPLLLVATLVFSHSASAAKASLLTDLQDINTEASALQTQLAGITLSVDSVCGPLVNANQATRDLVNSIAAVNDNLAAPVSVDADAPLKCNNNFVSESGVATTP